MVNQHYHDNTIEFDRCLPVIIISIDFPRALRNNVNKRMSTEEALVSLVKRFGRIESHQLKTSFSIQHHPYLNVVFDDPELATR